MHPGHLNSAVTILQHYDGSMPFSHYIRQYFAQHKKFGSSDRRNITTLCYNFFRMGTLRQPADVAERVLLGTFLCSRQPNVILDTFKPEWAVCTALSPAEKWRMTGMEEPLEQLFPFADALSPAVDSQSYSLSFLQQPKLFLRQRPGQWQVPMKLAEAGIEAEMLGPDTLALPNGAKADVVLALNREAVVQDYNSQQVGSYFAQLPQLMPGHTTFTVWDCCAASGGKSILIADILKQPVQLTVTDVRPTILQNLEQRLTTANIKGWQSHVADLASGKLPCVIGKYDVIICDAPCSGSGTWPRTPEQVSFFKREQIAEYAALQQKIVQTALQHLLPGGVFYYITCSVFYEENEAQVQYILQQIDIQLHEQALLPGWQMQADSMFVAVFTRHKA